MTWADDQEWERQWWNQCTNTLREELLQMEYAKRMGLEIFKTDRSPYNINFNYKGVLDIGGGPVSMLLKGYNFSFACVADPCSFPDWVAKRYEAAGIHYMKKPAEELLFKREWDEVLIYNVLQHTIDPKRVLDNARGCGKIVRVFEFIDAGIGQGHPHNLTEAGLNEWLGIKGTTEDFREHGAVGKVYYGVYYGPYERN